MNAVVAKNQSYNLPVASGDLGGYLTQIAEIPILSTEEEKALAVRLRDHNDIEAARKLVMSQLRFVVHIARSYSGYGLPLGDLVQEGNIGLMKAVKRFDPEVGVRLISFAVHWIRAEIHEYVIRNWRIVKVATTKAQRKLFFKLRSAKKSLGWFTADEVEAVAEDLGVDPKVVMEMEGRLTASDPTYDAPSNADDGELITSPAHYLQSPEVDPAAQLEASDQSENDHNNLFAAMGELDERSRSIIERRWLTEDKATLHQLADEYSVSAERIRQLEKNAMNKLKGFILAA
ncbi:MAG: RNA polymerase sigma factor RpoH [Pseudomonadota bacterium]